MASQQAKWRAFWLDSGDLHPLSARNSAGTGTCHVAADLTGRCSLAADYTGRERGQFPHRRWQAERGGMDRALYRARSQPDSASPWRTRILRRSRLTTASPTSTTWAAIDSYLQAHPATAEMTPAGTYRATGLRPAHAALPSQRAHGLLDERTGVTVDVLNWHKDDGGLTFVDRIALLPPDYKPSACLHRLRYGDLARRPVRLLCQSRQELPLCFQGRFRRPGQTDADEAVELRRQDAAEFHARSHGATGCWWRIRIRILISVFRGDPESGELAEEGKSVAAEAPMRILFV